MTFRPLALLGCASVLLMACASNKGPERPEKRQMDPERMERLYNQFVERWDYNEDGMATCDDISVQRARLFKRLDTDESGALTSGEYRYAKFEDKSFMFFALDRVDTNASAEVDLEEFVAVSHSEFLNLDKDGNCAISQREAIAALRELRGGQEGHGRGQGQRGRGGRGMGGKRGGITAPAD